MLDFAGKRWWYLTISLVLFLVAAVALVLWGLKPGIEFTSGSSFTIEFTERDVVAAGGDTGVASLVFLSELSTCGLQHVL